MNDLTEVCETQNDIIKAQADIIDELFLQVMEYTDVEHEEKVLDMIEDVTQKEAKLWTQ